MVLNIPKHLQKPDAVQPDDGPVRVKIEEPTFEGLSQGRNFTSFNFWRVVRGCPRMDSSATMIKSFALAWVWSQEADMPNYDYGISPEIHTKYRRETLESLHGFMSLKKMLSKFSTFIWRPAVQFPCAERAKVSLQWMIQTGDSPLCLSKRPPTSRGRCTPRFGWASVWPWYHETSTHLEWDEVEVSCSIWH